MFEPSVANRVPLMLRTLCMVWSCLVLISAATISIPEREEDGFKEDSSTSALIISRTDSSDEYQAVSDDSNSTTQDEERTADTGDEQLSDGERSEQPVLVSLLSCLYSLRFWQYFWMVFFSNVFGGIFSYQFKNIFEAHYEGADADYLMAYAASMSGVVQFVTRIAVGHLYDRHGFKAIFNFLMTINTLNGLVCYQVKTIPWLYIICIELNYVVLGGIYPMFVAPVNKTFGLKYGP